MRSGPNLVFSQEILVADFKFPLGFGAFNVDVAEEGMALEFIMVASVLNIAPQMLAIFHFYSENFQHVASIIKTI